MPLIEDANLDGYGKFYTTSVKISTIVAQHARRRGLKFSPILEQALVDKLKKLGDIEASEAVQTNDLDTFGLFKLGLDYQRAFKASHSDIYMELGEHCEFIVNGFFLNFDGSQRGNLLQLTDDDVRKYVERKINMLREKIILRQDARVVLSDKLFQKIKERLDAIKSVDKTEKEEFKIKSEAYNKLEFGADGLPIDKTELSRILQYKPKEKRLEQEEVKAGEGEATQ